MSATPALKPAPTAADDMNATVNEPAEDAQASSLPANEPEEKAATAALGKTEVEQKETKEEEVHREPQDGLAAKGRMEAAARVRQSTSLPPVLKERLAALVESSGDAVGDGKFRVPIEDAIRAVEEALPDFLRSDRGRASQPGHPAGDVFFSGDPSELTDAQAEDLARTQLARSGLLRGQRVRVAE